METFLEIVSLSDPKRFLEESLKLNQTQYFIHFEKIELFYYIYPIICLQLSQIFHIFHFFLKYYFNSSSNTNFISI